MTDLSNNAIKILNLFLYGQETTPADLTSKDLIRAEPSAPLSVSIDMSEYMEDGPGRFALASRFTIVQMFLGAQGVVLAPGEYTKEEIGLAFQLASYGLTISQVNFGDSIDDYLERALIHNTTAFEIADEARFIVNADGSRYIENLAVIPRTDVQENFDFEGSGLSSILNPTLQNRMDPSEIGHRVNINFSGSVASVEHYGIDEFLADQQTESTWATPYTELIISGSALLDELFEDGLIRFLDDLDRPIIYSQNAGGDVSQVIADGAHYLKNFTGNGVHFVGSGAADNFSWTAAGSVVHGNGGDDSFVNLGPLSAALGGAGEDTFSLLGEYGGIFASGGEDDDTFVLTAGKTAILWGGAGSDTFNVSSAAGQVNVIVAHDPQITDELLAIVNVEDLLRGFIPSSRINPEESYIIILNPEADDIFSIDGIQVGVFTYSEIAQVQEHNWDHSWKHYGLESAGFYAATETYSYNGQANASDYPLTVYTDFDTLPGSYSPPGVFNGPVVRIFGTIGSAFGWQIPGEANVPAWERYHGFEGWDLLDEVGSSLLNGYQPQSYYFDYNAKAKNVVNGTSGADILSGTSGNDRVSGREGDDELIAGSGLGDDHYDGGSEIDTIRFSSTSLGVEINLELGFAEGAETGFDTIVEVENIVAGSGSDILVGDQKDNRLTGAGGADVLTGGNGNDIYVYNRGDGDDTIIEGGSEGDADVLQLNGVNALTQTVISASGYDLLIEIDPSSPGAGDEGSILIKDFLNMSGDYGVEIIIDGDNNTFTKTDVFQFLYGNLSGGLSMDGTSAGDTLIGTAQADEFNGLEGNDLLVGRAGEDTLDGGNGDDILDGGGGDDWLVGGAGADTFVFRSGTGQDGISDFTTGLDLIEIHAPVGASFSVLMAAAEEWGGNAWLYLNSQDVIVVYGVGLNDLSASDFNFVDTEEEPPGSTLNEILGTVGDDELHGTSAADYIFGDSGTDELYGGGGDDVIEGGAGDDWLVGETGADTFVFRAGFGEDGIGDFELDVDTLEFHDKGALDFAGLMANAEEWGGNAWLHLDNGDIVVIHGVGLNDLSASDFRFM